MIVSLLKGRFLGIFAKPLPYLWTALRSVVVWCTQGEVFMVEF